MAGRARGYVLTIFPDIEAEFPWDPNTINWSGITPAIQAFTCQLEETPSTGRIHWQCAVEFKSNVTFKQVQECKAWVASKKPHIERRKGTAIQARDYCLKDETCVCPDTRFTYGFITPVAENKETVFREALQAQSFREAIERIRDGSPRDFILHHESITRALLCIFKTPATNDCFNWCFNMAQIPKTTLGKYAAFLYGASGTGKTSFALSHFRKPVLIRHIDDAKGITDETDGVVFDDMSFTHWPRTSCIHILDLEHDSPLPTRYATTTLRRGLHRIFTSNETFTNVFNCKGNDGEFLKAALLRRSKRYHILTPLIHSKVDPRFRQWEIREHHKCTILRFTEN